MSASTAPSPASRLLLADAVLERLLVFVLAAGFSGLLLAMAGQFTAPAAWVLGALLAWIYHRWAPWEAGSGLALAQVLPVLLLALFFRVQPFDYVLGGQDQGVYTAMAAELVQTQDLSVRDDELSTLSAAGQRANYVRDNYTVPFLPGVYSDPEHGLALEFQFYHLFPVWLAMFGGVFGMAAAGYGLVVLGLLSIVCFQRLALALSGSERIGMLAAGLLAINPLHAFFSRFPVTEVPTLAFSTAGFAFLVMYANSTSSQRPRRWLALSVAAFMALFLTRISGFMYLPLFGLVALAALLLDPDRRRGHDLNLWALATVAAYALSVAYGLLWSGEYSRAIYEASFSMLGGAHWPQLVALFFLLGVGLWACAWRWPQHPVLRHLARGLDAGRAWLGPLLMLVLALGAWRAWRLAFSDHYLQDPWLSQFPGLVGQGWSSLGHSSLVVVLMYLGPLVFLAVAALMMARLPARAALLGVFVLCFITYAALLNWTVPYQPYYARYFCSELVPYALLFAACGLAWIDSERLRRVLAASLVLSALWFLPLSWKQVGKQENAGARESIARLAAFADEGDVILLDNFHGPGFYPKEVKTALVYQFGRHVVSIGDRSLADFGYLQAVADAYDDVFLVTEARRAPAGFVRVDAVRLRAKGFKHTDHPPSKLVTSLDANLRVFRLQQPSFAPGSFQDIDAATDPRVLHQVGLRRSGVGMVADGRAGYLAYGPYLALEPGSYKLALRGDLAEGRAGGAEVEVAYSHGEQVIAGRLIQAGQGGLPEGVLAELGFEVPESGASDLEVRVKVTADSAMSVAGYRLSRLR